MEFPESRRDQIVVGLSICALILFMANIATFVKQRFFEDNPRHALFVAEAHGNQGEHVWELEQLADGNTAWAIRSDECHGKRHRHIREIHREHERAHRERAARFAWKLQGDDALHFEMDAHEEDLERMLEEARRAARDIEIKLGMEAPRLDASSLQELDIKVEESQDETGRHRYRVVVRPDNN